MPEPRASSIGELETIWKTIGVDTSTLVIGSGGSIAPPPGYLRTGERTALADLPGELLRNASLSGDFVMGDTIGEGGMGIVRSAAQQSLGRRVAIKSVRPSIDNEEATLALLREAWVTGALDHPNIVPVHALARDDEGRPVFVMKHIDGVPWSQLIADPEHPLMDPDRGEVIDVHMDIFQQVCDAIHFAHERGVLHRDIKPDNVMVGQFGEVYVLDWGLAAALDERFEGRIPSTADLRVVAGTPAYMAPEMAAGNGASFGRCTDVYLLGAVLHEVLTGKPRHCGATIHETLFNAYRSAPPEFALDVPTELAEICARATCHDTGLRFASARELRGAVARYRQHRASFRLLHDAEERHRELASLLALEHAALPDPENGQDSGHRGGEFSGVSEDSALDDAALDVTVEREMRIDAVAQEAAFAYGLALREWDENVVAAEGLHRLQGELLAIELTRENLAGAERIARELGDRVAPEHLEALEVLRASAADRASRFAELQRFEADMDTQFGQRTRAFIAVIMAVIYTALPLVLGGFVHFRDFELTAGFLQGTALSFLLLTAGGLSWARHTLFANRSNRIVSLMMACIAICLNVYALGQNMIGASPIETLTTYHLIFGLFSACMAVVFDWRLIIGAVGFVAAYIAATLHPGSLYVAGAAANLLACMTFAYVWRPDEFRVALPEGYWSASIRERVDMRRDMLATMRETGATQRREAREQRAASSPDPKP